MLLLNRTEVSRLLDPAALIPALERGFEALSAGQLNVPPRTQAVAPRGILLAMPAYMPAQAMSTKLVTVFHGNREYGIPDHLAMIALFDENTGATLAVMDGEHITAMRTAAGAMVSVKHLARKNRRVAAIVGAGVLGHAHLAFMNVLGGFEQVLVASSRFAQAQALAARATHAEAVDSIQAAVTAADVVCLCTSSSQPVIRRDWIKAGTHVTSVGYRPPGGELPRDLIDASHLFVESRVAFQPPPVGSAELQGLDATLATELGECLLGRKPGRRDDSEITLYKSMGHAMEDLVAANLVYQKALELKCGTTFDIAG